MPKATKENFLEPETVLLGWVFFISAHKSRKGSILPML